MILFIDILINIVITLLGLMIVKKYSKINNEKAMHLIRIIFSLKFFIYIPSAFIMSYFLLKYQYKNFFSLIPTLFIILLMLFDSIVFYKESIKIRGVQITLMEYIIELIKESILIILPVCILLVLKNIFVNTGTFFYTFTLVTALFIFNLLYPYLMRLRFKNCSKNNILSDELSNKFNFHINIYIYNGKASKDSNALVCGLLYTFNIFISDFLIENMSESEINTILLHEIGHIKKHHTLIKNTILISSIPIMITIGAIMDEWEKFFGEINRIGGIIFFLLILFLYSVILFLYISRKQEFEADKFAINNGADIFIYSEALNKLKNFNLFVNKRNFIEEIFSTHPSIKKRILRLKSYQIEERSK